MDSFIQSSQLLKADYHHPVLHVTLNLRVVNYLTQEVSLFFIGKRFGPCACVKYLAHGNDFALISESDFLERTRISEGTGRKWGNGFCCCLQLSYSVFLLRRFGKGN